MLREIARTKRHKSVTFTNKIYREILLPTRSAHNSQRAGFKARLWRQRPPFCLCCRSWMLLFFLIFGAIVCTFLSSTVCIWCCCFCCCCCCCWGMWICWVNVWTLHWIVSSGFLVHYVSVWAVFFSSQDGVYQRFWSFRTRVFAEKGSSLVFRTRWHCHWKIRHLRNISGGRKGVRKKDNSRGSGDTGLWRIYPPSRTDGPSCW